MQPDHKAGRQSSELIEIRLTEHSHFFYRDAVFIVILFVYEGRTHAYAVTVNKKYSGDVSSVLPLSSSGT